MSIHPEAISPRAARDMYFDHAIQRQSIEDVSCIEMMIYGIAVKVVQIEQKIAAALLSERVEKLVLIPDLRISRKLRKIVGWIFQQEGHAVALLNICASLCDKFNSLDRRGHRQ